MEKLFDLDNVINLRRELHQNPELSDSEFITSERIARFLSHYNPDELIRGIGGNGIACIFKSKNEGPSILFRCDLDALPIDETSDIEYRSVNKGASHACGHDGHMAIVAGLADVFSKNPPKKGQVVLLFQPSEENGQGALRVLNDNRFKKIKVNYVFALHNLPGFSDGEIVLCRDTFASASKGMIIKLYGKTAHASEPENGNSPAIAMAEIINGLTELTKKRKFSDFSLITIIYARLGDVAFGTTPGYAEIMATLRTYSNSDMEKLVKDAENIAGEFAKKGKLEYKMSYVEEFPATINNNNLVEEIENIAKSLNYKYSYKKKPLRWSEDFAHFAMKFPGVLFGLGVGVNHSQLHNPDYDFPDKIIENGVKIYYEISRRIVNYS